MCLLVCSRLGPKYHLYDVTLKLCLDFIDVSNKCFLLLTSYSKPIRNVSIFKVAQCCKWAVFFFNYVFPAASSFEKIIQVCR